jgi:tripartite-type tricarboxylate transporter receptor subunit TctC
VPTLTDAGFPVVFTQWTALFVPAGAPESAIAKLRDAARSAVADPKFIAAMATVETPIQYLDAPELQRFWDADNQKLGDAVRRIGKLE